MDKPHSSTQILLKSSLTPDQLKVQSLWHQCDVKVDSKTFLQIWRLSELGIPTHAVIALLNDIARYGGRKI